MPYTPIRPVFVPAPVVIRHTRECIEQDGKRFCESQEMSEPAKQELGFVLLALVVWFVLIITAITQDMHHMVVIGLFIGPLVLVALCMIF